jgi:DNA-binding NarL/FixJ family response regulator
LADAKTNHKTNILIVDDHPMTVDSYVSLLTSVSKEHDFEFHLAYTCGEAHDRIKMLKSTGALLDFAFLDVNLPASEEKKLMSGIDIATQLKSVFPDCKIIIITMHKEPVWVNRIFKSLSPEGFVSKNDINYRVFPDICKNLLDGLSYFSPSILESQRFFIKKNINWDEHDSKILLLLSQGVKTIHLPEHIPLSLSSIEKRKANIKKQLVFENGSDKELIDVAQKLGLL